MRQEFGVVSVLIRRKVVEECCIICLEIIEIGIAVIIAILVGVLQDD